MRLRTLILRSLRFHWRSHLGVALGAAVATAVLVGALVVGDSVRYSLRRTALARLGQTDVALASGDRLFRTALADDVAAALGVPTAAVLQVRGVASRTDEAARINQVQVVGVDERFWAMGGLARPPLATDAAGGAVVSASVARRLNVAPGDTITVRVEKPSALPLDAPLSGAADAVLALRVTVRAIVDDDAFGRYSLAANQAAPHNIFVPLEWLQKQLEQPGRANVLLAGDGGRTPLTARNADSVLRHKWQLADAQLDLVSVAWQGAWELRSERVFLDTPITHALAEVEPAALGILTYFVNELRVGDRATPYSLVTAVGNLKPSAVAKPTGLAAHLEPAELADDEIIINTWLAEDLAAKAGDTLQMTYWVPGPMRGLETRTRRFTIRDVVPITGLAGDRTLMPDFPGLADVDNCRDWKPGIPIDLQAIRDKDQAYWTEFRGTPKAFVSLAAGQRMWANRFGNLTAVRFPAADRAAEKFRTMLRIAIDPGAMGLTFQPVRERGLAASSQGVDFGMLFLGLSFFLVAAALVLTGLLFAFNAQQRAEETGTLLALGYRPRRVRRLLLAEGGLLAAAGGLAGMLIGLMYTRIMLYGLATAWQSAVGSADIIFHAEPLSLAAGTGAGVLVALAVVWLTVRRQARAPARELLASGAEAELRLGLPQRARPWIGGVLALAAALGAAALLPMAGSAKGEAAAGAFFGLGALLLIALLGLFHMTLAMQARAAAQQGLTFAGLGRRNATRRRGRSLATVTLVACGAFLVVAVGANRKDPQHEASLRSSGTGGFALLGETSLPVLHDLAGPAGRKAYALPESLASEIAVVPLRVHEGDEASCLNLNRALRPRLMGVRPAALAERGAFTFAETAPTSPDAADKNPWMLLAEKSANGVVPAIGDATTIQWSLGTQVGGEIPYTDARGHTFRLKIVGAVAGSILQGGLVISEENFIARFPSESGYRMFLIDAPAARAGPIAGILSERLADVGLAVVPAAERLAELNSVENTYLAIFQALGGLGLALGSVGLGVVVLRNVLERRSELALMRAVGYRRGQIERLVLYEHWGLLAWGLAAGTLAAGVAVSPSLRSAGAAVPYVSLSLTLAAVAVSGLAWTYLATRLALRGPLLEALRNE